MPRNFTDSPAVLREVPLLIGITGYSGSGKTFSAHRLARGIQRVRGGDIFGIDTEGGRMLQYSDRFKFRHVPFVPPHGPADYLQCIDYCVAKGARTIIIDSMSHEHDGDGGYLEMSEQYLDAKAGDDWKRRKQLQQLSWQQPAYDRKKLNNRITTQLTDVTFIFCYRGKHKQKMVKGEDPVDLGIQAVTTSNLIYDMTVRFLLRPGADGRPAAKGETEAESMMMKSIETFRGWTEMRDQLSEDLGERLARWAAGDTTLMFATSWSNKEWAGKPVVGAPAKVICDYIAALEKARKPIPAELQAHFDELSAAEMDRAQESSPPTAADPSNENASWGMTP